MNPVACRHSTKGLSLLRRGTKAPTAIRKVDYGSLMMWPIACSLLVSLFLAKQSDTEEVSEGSGADKEGTAFPYGTVLSALSGRFPFFVLKQMSRRFAKERSDPLPGGRKKDRITVTLRVTSGRVNHFFIYLST